MAFLKVYNVFDRKLHFCVVVLIVILLFSGSGVYNAILGSSFNKNADLCHVARTPANKQWYDFTRNESFIFYPGLDSPGGDIQITGESGCLEELCRYTVGCIGFTSNGLLKERLLPYEDWVYSSSIEGGLYVLAFYNCSINSEPNCPLNTSGIWLSDGRYTFKKTNVHSAELKAQEEPSAELTVQEEPSSADIVHVVLSVDGNESQGLLALLSSLQQHCSKTLIVHIVTSASNILDMQRNIACAFGTSQMFQIDIIEFDIPESVKELMVVHSKKLQYLANAGNYARFYFPKLFPYLMHILYLDVDLVVLHDVSNLWKVIIKSDNLITAVPRRKKMESFFTDDARQLYKIRYGKDQVVSRMSYNAGVIGFNLKKWRENNLTGEVVYWMRMNKLMPLWGLGTQPLMYIVVGDDWKRLNAQWNVDGLGWTTIPRRRLTTAHILHWTGLHKPWMTAGKYVQYWSKYNTSLCNGRGACISAGESGGICECDREYGGDYCEITLH